MDIDQHDATLRAGDQMHFLQLCDVLGEPHPASQDFSGATYTFEKGGTTIEGKQGFADVWKRGCFGWEYKGKHRDLNVAYQQPLKYREDLENPPLVVVCDLERFEIHTNFTDTAKQVYRISLDDLLKNQATADCNRRSRWPPSSQPSRTPCEREALTHSAPRTS